MWKFEKNKSAAIISVTLILTLTLFASGCLDSVTDSGDVRIVNVSGRDDFGYDPVVYATIENTYSSSKEVEVRFQVITSRDTYSSTRTIVVPGDTTDTYSARVSRTPLTTTQRYEATIISYS